MRNCLKRCTIAISGEFGPGRSNENIKRWIKNNGGTLASGITEDVTHVVCSEMHYKRKTGIVQKAQVSKKIKIVSFDWLEDTLRRRSPRREGPYLWKNLLVTNDKSKNRATKSETAKTVKKTVREKAASFAKGCDDSIDSLLADIFLLSANGTGTGGPENYHLYQDETGLVYDVTLLRTDDERKINERYHLKLFESHFFPSCYATAAKYYRNSISTAIVLAPVASTFETAFEKFQSFFRGKTGKAWEDRFSEDQTSATRTKVSDPEGRFLQGLIQEIETSCQPFLYVAPSNDSARSIIQNAPIVNGQYMSESEIPLAVYGNTEKQAMERVWDKESLRILLDEKQPRS
ncbi:hypothetical protein L228DRAFT_250720 [Xylona heveae TC161]|uniref:Uncharacterized protein n=1 Tax=Xylona heveae (strain CBS 132557 / TC161) TaxID=1328760 RepID=A0A164ZXF0_XYLHT|nr:hypothetical protein L228DRAFT_250720 [Xylona heveae TC161]KZF19658.1 hypothetical protein L228DRAFT_250720 [Xylona heveae TC161]